MARDTKDKLYKNNDREFRVCDEIVGPAACIMSDVSKFTNKFHKALCALCDIPGTRLLSEQWHPGSKSESEHLHICASCLNIFSLRCGV